MDTDESTSVTDLPQLLFWSRNYANYHWCSRVINLPSDGPGIVLLATSYHPRGGFSLPLSPKEAV